MDRKVWPSETMKGVEWLWISIFSFNNIFKHYSPIKAFTTKFRHGWINVSHSCKDSELYLSLSLMMHNYAGARSMKVCGQNGHIPLFGKIFSNLSQFWNSSLWNSRLPWNSSFEKIAFKFAVVFFVELKFLELELH